MNRRRLLVGATSVLGFGLAGCSARSSRSQLAPSVEAPPPNVAAMYAALPDERFPLPAVAIEHIPEKFWRQRVDYASPHRPGTIIVDTRSFFLHLVEPGDTAMRYGVSLGKAGFGWSGRGIIQWKRPWPTWTPPDSMIERVPELEQWSERNGGMPAGPNNPLGARALYIFQDGVDTLYRVHGTPDNRSIGRAVSSGCVRMINVSVRPPFQLPTSV